MNPDLKHALKLLLDVFPLAKFSLFPDNRMESFVCVIPAQHSTYRMRVLTDWAAFEEDVPGNGLSGTDWCVRSNISDCAWSRGEGDGWLSWVRGEIIGDKPALEPCKHIMPWTAALCWDGPPPRDQPPMFEGGKFHAIHPGGCLWMPGKVTITFPRPGQPSPVLFKDMHGGAILPKPSFAQGVEVAARLWLEAARPVGGL